MPTVDCSSHTHFIRIFVEFYKECLFESFEESSVFVSSDTRRSGIAMTREGEGR